MNDLLDHDDPSLSRQDRELTLGTGTILGIFFGLVVLCGACFGVGYTMGHKSAPTPLTIADASPDAAGGSNGIPKPSAGSPLDGLTSTPPVAIAPPAATAVPAPKPAPVVRKPPPPAVITDDDDPTPASSTVSARTPTVKPVAPTALLPSVAAAPSSPGSIMVQVAAVSHQEDADLLIGALRARGYAVAARSSVGDSLIHVQVGPFSSKPAAEAMRQKLMADGYNALLKY